MHSIHFTDKLAATSPSPAKPCAPKFSVEGDTTRTRSDDSINVGKSSQLGKHFSGDCITLLDRVITVRTCCFDIDFVSQIKLNKLPLIHCFGL